MAWDPHWHKPIGGVGSLTWLPDELAERLAALAYEWELHPARLAAILLERMLSKAEVEPVCRGCGCSHFDPCFDDGDQACAWVDGDESWCSHCAAKAREAQP